MATDPKDPTYNPLYGNNQKTQGKKGWKVKDPAVKPDTDPKQRVDLQVGDFDKLIEQKGVNLKVYRSMYCPNVKSVDGAEHEIDCQLCNASGFIDLYPICVKGFIQNQDLERLMDTPDGQHDGNSVSITFPIGVELQYFTRIELTDYTDLYYQRVLRKSDSLIDVLKFRACRINVVVDQLGNQYFQDQDFTIDPNGNIKWTTSGRKPTALNVYSIHYEMHVQYRAIKAMHVSRFTQYRANGDANIQFIKMPEQWLCTKEFLLRRRDINTNQDLNQGPFGQHTNTTGENDDQD